MEIFAILGAGGASVPGVLLAEQPESKRERATGVAGHDAASERPRPARTSDGSLSASKIPSSPPPSPPSSSPSSPSTTTYSNWSGRRSATSNGRHRWPSDAWHRRSGRQHDVERRWAQDDRFNLQRRSKNRHVYARQGDHLRERSGSRSSGRVSTTTTITAISIATLGSHKSWIIATHVCYT